MMDRGFAETENGKILAGMARNCRMIFFTGLPASGKSFFIRALISMAGANGRRVHLMRWDAGLAPFQTDDILARYPDVADGSHPIVRKAAGLWGRQAVARWLDLHPDHADLLVGEFPIVGNRFSELVKVLPDEVEAALVSLETAFVYPVPTRKMYMNRLGLVRFHSCAVRVQSCCFARVQKIAGSFYSRESGIQGVGLKPQSKITCVEQ